MRLIIFILSLLFFLFPVYVSANEASSSSSRDLHLDWLDKSVDPGNNFFAYANGHWQKQNPIPAAYASWDNFYILQDQNQDKIKQIIEAIVHDDQISPGSLEQKIGDFYYSGMDEATVNAQAAQPLQAEITRINTISTVKDLQKDIAHLQLVGVSAVFDFGQMQDFKNSSQVIGIASQAGLGLPDRDYYLNHDKKYKQIRIAYVNYMVKTFSLLGDSRQKAIAEAKTVMIIETKLAQAFMPSVEQRNLKAIYHPMDLKQLQKLTPHLSWQQFFNDIDHPEIQRINMATPNYFKTVNAMLENTSLQDWKIYLRWHLVQSFSPFLSTPYVNESLHMAKALTGIQALLPRWKRVVNAENLFLGFGLGKLYVDKYFPASAKEQIQDIVKNIRMTLRNNIQHLSWMSEPTRLAALKKLDLMEARIGYPDKWWDYSSLKIDRGPYVLNVMRANEFLNKRELNKIGKPVDKTEWDMAPQTVNAYYDASSNRLNIPAGILQAPFFDAQAPAALNYGGIGFVIGHEMIHGFDDQGAQFDGQGNVKSWWTKEDLAKFKTATLCVADQYSKYDVGGDQHLQGKLVVGEATADLGGLNLAYQAFHDSDAYKQSKVINHFSPDQQFFLGAAHVWATNMRPEALRASLVSSLHPPAWVRVNETLSNMSAFQLAYGLKEGSGMVNRDKCHVW